MTSPVRAALYLRVSTGDRPTTICPSRIRAGRRRDTAHCAAGRSSPTMSSLARRPVTIDGPTTRDRRDHHQAAAASKVPYPRRSPHSIFTNPDSCTAAFWPSMRPTSLMPWRTPATNDVNEAHEGAAEKANDRDLWLLSACCKRQRDRPAENIYGGAPHMHVPCNDTLFVIGELHLRDC